MVRQGDCFVFMLLVSHVFYQVRKKMLAAPFGTQPVAFQIYLFTHGGSKGRTES